MVSRSLNFLEEKAIKDPIQKETFFNQLNTLLAKFPSVDSMAFGHPIRRSRWSLSCRC